MARIERAVSIGKIGQTLLTKFTLAYFDPGLMGT
jgi:hypothetical protein